MKTHKKSNKGAPKRIDCVSFRELYLHVVRLHNIAVSLRRGEMVVAVVVLLLGERPRFAFIVFFCVLQRVKCFRLVCPLGPGTQIDLEDAVL